MNPTYHPIPLTDNAYDQQFELAVNGATALLQYQLHHQYLSLIHTEVPAALQGQGVGSALVEKVLLWAQERHLTIIPLCPFVAHYIHRHPAWYQLVAPGYRPAGAAQ
ncbi:GNAT family N-acetyltransferase [Hymenobacter wooponensis]|uniref:N-acetyltransferase n=1 Tax=Hymenobacter wooponensis TaxID=1525360 RepID=A0A4Z0MCU4_9BACT|nr:GNAT family N-acetyltransferase [Hymenobacter wooponensis]TGD77543.1 N-acetyltransferase [Hymenobacter wooponensis]